MSGQASSIQSPITPADVMRGFPPPLEARVTLSNCGEYPFSSWWITHYRELLPTVGLKGGAGPVWEFPHTPRDISAILYDDCRRQRSTVEEMLDRTFTDALIVLHHGRIVAERYYGTYRPETPHLLCSAGKSFTACPLAILAQRGQVDFDRPITDYLPELAGSAYEGATVQQLVDMQVAIDWGDEWGEIADEGSDIYISDSIAGWHERTPETPSCYLELAQRTRKKGTHGELFHYISVNTQLASLISSRVTGEHFADVLSSEIWSKLGPEHEAYIGLDPACIAMVDGAFCVTLRDLARFGQMICQDGVVRGEQVLPYEFIVDLRTRGRREAFDRSIFAGRFPGATYRSFFWVSQLEDHTTISAFGSYGQMCYVNREAEVVVVKLSSQPVVIDQDLIFDAWYAAEGIARALA